MLLYYIVGSEMLEVSSDDEGGVSYLGYLDYFCYVVDFEMFDLSSDDEGGISYLGSLR